MSGRNRGQAVNRESYPLRRMPEDGLDVHGSLPDTNLTSVTNIFNIVEYMAREFLGGFELLVLLALIRLGDEAYGVPIGKAIQESSGRDVALGSVYVALERLETKGFVTSERGEPTAVRGGRAKTFFRITARGLREARTAQRTLIRLWRGVPQLKGTIA